ncbi:Glycosidase [Rubritalea squalenifaciens DSM 18772]|uniref:Glycosidase n=2 Tax=Rubritalea TaxID=361050 RepID=A0A1M6B8S0_9BACT|nr:alpha-amylase family glycosyl hydrolase [Rubritalea squalenifaciens]SHI45096.1 Glycosidase [Rubritalea squalenifaciens DSM 18772]
MGDFHQFGIVTTLHQLNQRPLEKLEEELMEFRKRKPMALVLPSLFSELEGPALSSIVDQIAQVPYLDQIVIGLDRADEDQFRYALKFFDRLPQRPNILWNDGPRLRKIDQLLREKGLAPKEAGKGRNVWYMFGYILASGKAETVALHDCDILTYDRSLLAHLIYPVANPEFSFKFCKGYYARIANNSMNGRVCRLLVTPLLRALNKVCKPDSTYLEYLDSFRYPLAGEFSLQRDVIEDIRIPSDWGLEMGILSEMHRNYATNQICQVDIADVYDHKHQDLSLKDKTRGLSKMSCDIAKSLYRKMATQGEVFTPESIRTIKATYYRIALDLVDSYQADAKINGLDYDLHTEGSAIEVFAENIMQAGHDFLDPEQSMATPFMPSWKRVRSAVPDIMEMLRDAVEGDLREFGSKSSYDPAQHPKVVQVRQKIRQHVHAVYGDERCDAIVKRIFQTAPLAQTAISNVPQTNKWDQSDVLAITYADSIKREGEMPLQTLRHFFQHELKHTINNIHILPFCPYSSDDGFSVIDYKQVKEEHGSWDDIQDFQADFKVMADLVLNHCSSESEWFKNFLACKDPGKDYFVTGDKFQDLRFVVRPRSTPLLTTVETAEGEKEVWCTFSADQVDLDFSNPDVLIEIIEIIRLYLEKGIRLFRLDAVAFLWKEDGSNCVHLPQTHEIIKLLRVVIETLEPSAIIITETNVPNKENLSYFGNDNEAHLIYNFSLPPLLLQALLSGNCKYLKKWIMSMPPARRGRAYLNFIASHDGIGLRPAEGLLSDKEQDTLMQTIRDFGGEISMRRMPDGQLKPYEANISLYSALAGTIEGGKDQWQTQRFLCAHTILLALEGLPALYIHSLLGTENNTLGVAETGRLRTINRYQWDADGLYAALEDENLHHQTVFSELKRLIQIRRKQPAFHPNATQYTLHFGEKIFAFWRESLHREQSIFALHNISTEAQSIPLVELNLIATDTWCDLLSGETYTSTDATIELPPYGCVWISNKKL